VSYIDEKGAHAGPSAEELHTFVVAPSEAPLPASLNHPLQLYEVFIRYQLDGESTPAECERSPDDSVSPARHDAGSP
jgi:hypothetical protein